MADDVPKKKEAERLALAVAAAGRWCPPDVRTVDAGALVAMLKDDVILVDARTAKERNVSRMAQSLSIVEFEEKYKGDRIERPVVVYCTIGARSGKYARSISGRCRAYNSTGIVPFSFAEEANAGPLALVDADGRPATKIHVFARPWDLASERFEAVMFGPLEAFLVTFFPSWYYY